MADMTRRTALLCATLALGAGRMARADAATAWDFSFPSIEGATLDFADQRGRVLLVVNTASFCGFTYQYGALEKLQADLSPRGLTVVGVPSQDFNQESGSNGEVKQFCEATFGVQFPMTGLLHVRGREAHPFYRWVKARQNWEPEWNFNKVLVGRDGGLVGHYGSRDEPTGARLLGAVRQQLEVGV